MVLVPISDTCIESLSHSLFSCLHFIASSSFSSSQDALIDMVRRSKVHFVHCLLPKAEAVSGSGEPRVTHGESMDLGLMTLDVDLLRAQLRGSKLLDALRIYRQGKEGSVPCDTGSTIIIVLALFAIVPSKKAIETWNRYTNSHFY